MRTIMVSELVDFDQAQVELLAAYQALRKAAERENNLREFLRADLMVKSLSKSQEMMEAFLRSLFMPKSTNFYPYRIPPSFLYIESSDTVDDILRERFTFVYNAAYA